MMKKPITKTVDRINELWESRKYFLLSLYLIAIASLIAGAVFIAVSAVLFLVRNVEAIIALAILSSLVVIGIKDRRRNKKEEKEKWEAEQNEKAAQITKAAAHESLSTVRECIFKLLQQAPPNLNLVKPATISEINSPTPIIERKGFYTYQFLAVCNGEINPQLVHDVLQVRLTQMTEAGDFSFPQVKFIHNGISRNILQIVSVVNTGSHAIFEAAIANEAFCEWLDVQGYVKSNQLQPETVDRKDWDFKS